MAEFDDRVEELPDDDSDDDVPNLVDETPAVVEDEVSFHIGLFKKNSLVFCSVF
jgi:hypothetical protein